MKLAVVAHEVSLLGGEARAAAEVIRRIAQDHDVTVLTRHCEITAPRLNWVPIRALRRPAIVGTWVFSRAAQRAQRTLSADVINSVGLAGRDSDVITAHFCLSAFRVRYGGLRGGVSALHRSYQRSVEEVFAAREQKAYRSPRLKAVIAVSEGLKRELVEFLGVAEQRIAVVPNGVDPAVFKPQHDLESRNALRRKLGLSESVFLCLFMGGDWDRKGLADAIQAVVGLREALLVVVGVGDIARFQALARKLGCERRVVFAGLTRSPQDYYATADVFVSPSRYESFSLGCLEALASGLPVLATRGNGTEDYLQHGVNGYFIETDAEAIREKLTSLIDDQALRSTMSRAAVASVTRYNWDRVADEQLAVFEAVSESGRRSTVPAGRPNGYLASLHAGR
jgi:glycosyltransferase involved in cell wall biosynthesis